jgi:3-oxoacyl-[acyl-carrier protein] reductase
MPVALITGASRGLGKQFALALSAEGYAIAVNYASSHKEATDLVEKLGSNSFAIKADVGNMGEVRTMAEKIRENFGRLDLLVNNAGMGRDDLLIKQQERDWDAVIRTNLKGCFNCIKTCAPIIIQSGGGHIINISSYSGVKGKAGQSAYSASKAALLGLTFSAARELSEYNIRVNAVLPGYLMTDMGRRAQKASEKAREDSILKKLSACREVAEFVLYLVKTEHISGQVLSLESRLM